MIAIAVAIATQGAGAALLGGAGALGATGAAMADAGFSALVSQASLSLINNRGDIGAVLKDLGSSSALKSLASAVVTAGIISGVANSGALDGLTANADQGAQLSTLERVQNAAVNNLARSLVNTAANVAISGKPLDETLRAQLLSAAAGVIGQVGATEIGDAAKSGDINTAAQYIAHAALGCGIGAVGGGDCASGATGAVVGEVAGELYAHLNSSSLSQVEIDARLRDWQKQGLDIAMLSAALGAFISGLDVSTAAGTAMNAALYNTMQHISRGVNGMETLAEHRATIIEEDNPSAFSADLQDKLGPPVQFSNGKYGYVLEFLKSDGNLVMSVNVDKSGSSLYMYNKKIL